MTKRSDHRGLVRLIIEDRASEDSGRPLVGVSALLAVGACYGLFAVFVRELRGAATGCQQVFLRQAFAALFVAAALWAGARIGGRARRSRAPRRLGAPLVGFAVSCAAGAALFTFAVLRTSLAQTALSLYGGSMLASLLIGRFFFREQLFGAKVLALACCLAGVLVTGVQEPAQTGSLLGFVFGGLAGVAQAFSNAFRRALADSLPRLDLAGVQALAGAALGAVMLGAAGDAALPPLTLYQWGIACVSGAMSLLVALLLIVGFRNFDLALGIVVLSSEILFAALFGRLMYDECPTASELLGGALVLLGIALIALHTRRINRAADPRRSGAR